MLGSEVDDTTFDTDIIIHINTALFDLNQIGVGPVDGFAISGEMETWDDFLGYTSDNPRMEAVKTCVYLKVKLVFDPPENSTLIASMEKQIERLEWRLNVQAESPGKEE